MNTVMLYMLMAGQVMSTIATLLILAVMDKYLNNSHFTNEATIVAKEIPREGDRKWVGIILLLGLGGALVYNFRAVGVKLILMQMWTIFKMTSPYLVLVVVSLEVIGEFLSSRSPKFKEWMNRG